MANAAIGVKVSLQGLPEVQRACVQMPKKLNGWMKTGSTKGARKTLPKVKSNLKKNRRTGQLEKAQGVKFVGFRSGWTVMLGARKYFRASDPVRGTIDPVKYGHLLADGRKAVRFNKSTRRGGNGWAMPIFVKRLDPSLRNPYFLNRGVPFRGHAGYSAIKIGARRLVTYGRPTAKNATGQRFRKVPGGYLIFAMSAKRAAGTDWLGKESKTFGSNIQSGVENEIRNKLP